jgi:hypothetical protein
MQLTTVRLPDSHRLWSAFPCRLTQCLFCCGLLRFRSPLLAESSLFLGLLGCFGSSGALCLAYVFSKECVTMPSRGFPHSDISGSFGCTRLAGAFRSVPRPSSALIAKSSPLCPCSFSARTMSCGTLLGVFAYAPTNYVFLRATSTVVNIQTLEHDCSCPAMYILLSALRLRCAFGKVARAYAPHNVLANKRPDYRQAANVNRGFVSPGRYVAVCFSLLNIMSLTISRP